VLGQQPPSKRITSWVQNVIPTLRHALNEGSKNISNSSLATAVLFASLEIMSPTVSGVAMSWQKHLGLASQIITTRGGPMKLQNRCDKVGSFLWSWFAYIDVLGRLSGGSPLGDTFSAEWIFDYEIDAEEESRIDCILGFSTRCLHVLSEIAVLARICDRERLMAFDRGYRSQFLPSVDIVARAEKLESDLNRSLSRIAESCTHNRYANEEQSLENQGDKLEMDAVNNAFHWAGLIHLHRRLLGKPSGNDDVQNAVSQIMSALCHVRRGSRSEACMLFPMFTAGCSALDERLKADLLERIKGVERAGSAQTRKARALMERVWETGLPWEFLVTDEFPG